MSIVTDKYRGTKEYAKVYAELITAARYRGTITYQEIAMIMGIAPIGNNMQRLTGIMLGEISEDEVAHGRPMLSAIAVSVTNYLPSKGFYTLATQLGKLLPEEDAEKFMQKEQKAVYETWKVEIKG